MKFIFSSNTNLITNFDQVIFDNLPNSDGLWFPEEIPKIESNIINNLEKYDYFEIATLILSKYIDDIPLIELENIVNKSFTFKPILKQLSSNKFVLELFHLILAAISYL